MEKPASAITRRLADQAEAVCRRYLSKGRREGAYWLVGDVMNTPGRSLYVRLTDSADGRGQAGKWTDAATGEHGDLLDIIASVTGARALHEVLEEARRFLADPPAPSPDVPRSPQTETAPSGTPEAARKLFAASKPTAGTVAEAYLQGRGLPDLRGCKALRFHPRCWYHPAEDDPPDVRTAWPALIAAVTDLSGEITGVHRTWLDPATSDKASVAHPRRALGSLLGHGVRFGPAGPVMAAGEGLETMLSLRRAMPRMPTIAALSAGHLGAVLFPPALRRLYVARDDDPAGAAAVTRLTARAQAAGIELVSLSPVVDDVNTDLQRLGLDRLRAHLRVQLAATDVARFLLAQG